MTGPTCLNVTIYTCIQATTDDRSNIFCLRGFWRKAYYIRISTICGFGYGERTHLMNSFSNIKVMVYYKKKKPIKLPTTYPSWPYSDGDSESREIWVLCEDTRGGLASPPLGFLARCGARPLKWGSTLCLIWGHSIFLTLLPPLIWLRQAPPYQTGEQPGK